ncbi:MAG: acyl-CoA/acyl-ACP dehydrogenase [Deltaproteobacteria bacterium]|nr:acyl-CoA/acyl-ACP dehydrogenase [Deltaproteobacteria bacterium]MBW2361044.1 acyl-CoA/acyl-ACP dehydrogenase [Deltaproteobacteria bacterium]
MDFSLTEEQTAVRDLARKILEDLATNDRLKEVEAADPVFDRKLWAELAKANLLGVALPHEHGGDDMGFFTLCILLEEVGRSVAPVPVLASLALGALPLARFGSAEQQRRWLPAVARGEAILTAALQEPGNDDATRPVSEARRDGDDFVLNGEKTLVPAAQLADALLVPARTEDTGGALFLVEKDARGLTLEPQCVTDRQPYAALHLDGVRLPAAARVGPAGTDVLGWLAEHATVAICAVQCGVSDRALQMTADYSRERIQFERPIGSFQAVHQRAADAYILLQALQLTAWQAALRLEAGQPATDAVAVAKYWAAESGQKIGYACQHLHGGIGIDVDYPMHRYYLWAKQNELCLGAAPVQLERLGEHLASGSLISAD